MAKAQKRKVKGGRVTPKGGPPVAATSRTTPSASARYTPPVPKEMKVSPWWIPALMFGMLGVGTLVIILNYVELLPTWGFLPDETSNVWLLVGLSCILVGIIVATQWR